MHNFYTNVQVYGKKILYRGIENNKHVMRRVDFNPSLFVYNEAGDYKTVQGKRLKEIKPGNPRECKEFINNNSGIKGFEIYGNSRFEYNFISDAYPQDHIDWDIDHVNIMYIDIEVDSEGGYADPQNPWQEVTTIAMKMNGQVIVLGTKEFKTERNDVRYIKCQDEQELLHTFITIWTQKYPDVVTGWYIKNFDIPYLIKRITMVLGEEFAKKLSPWKFFYERSWQFMGKKQTAYVIYGVAQLDYIELYRKFTPKGASQESYTLNNISFVELGEKKVDYTEYTNLNGLYRENFQKFVEYNIHDIELVEKLDDKLKLLELALTLAYDSKCNYEDVFMQVRMWTVLTYNKLIKNKIVTPLSTNHIKTSYMGAYVKDPLIGLHNWIVSFDLTSLYPHLIMMYNISPDTIIEPENYSSELKKLLIDNSININSLLYKEPVITETLKKENVTLTPNGQFFDLSKKGFLHEMMEDMFKERNVYKNKMLEASKKLEKTFDPVEKAQLEKEKARYNNLQMTKKICLNSAYGALGNEFFLYFDVRQAEAITSAGQLAIRWIANDINDYLNKLLKTKDKDYVIASDTDSIYLSLDQLVNKTIIAKNPNSEVSEIISFMDRVCEDKIQQFINSSYNKLATYINAYDQKMYMKREVLCDKGIWTAKKRYILNVYDNEGVQYKEPKIKISGLEAIKSSTPSSCRDKIKEAIKVIMNQDEDALQDFVKEYKREFQTLPLEEIAFPRSVNGINKIRREGIGIPIHVKGAMTFNKILEEKKLNTRYEHIIDGSKIKYLLLKEPNPYHSHVLSFITFVPEEFDITEWVDYNTQFEKSFVQPLEMVTNVIGWKTKKVNTLENLFN